MHSVGNRRLRLAPALKLYDQLLRDTSNTFNNCPTTGRDFTENRWPNAFDFSFDSSSSSDDDAEDRQASPGSYNKPLRRQVSFADDYGKPLVSIKTFDGTPTLSSPKPESNVFNFNFRFGAPASPSSPVVLTEEHFEPLFPDPLSNYSGLVDRLHSQNVVLESICCRNGYLRTVIRAKDFGHNCATNINLRVTFDGWKSSGDWKADEFPTSPCSSPPKYGENYKVYEGLVPIPPHFRSNSIVEFAIVCRCEGDVSGEFWDNNNGNNYTAKYTSKTVSNEKPKHKTAAELESERAQRIRQLMFGVSDEPGLDFSHGLIPNPY